jgi:hypothetical protein
MGFLQRDLSNRGEFPKLSEKSPGIAMSEVKNQGDHGFCTAYAVSAVIEAITGVKVSEAELMLRLKTKRGDDRDCDGSHLYLFPEILREGIVLEANFPTTSDFNQYVTIRKRMIKESELDPSQRFGNTSDYKETIDEFIDWCQRASKSIPADLKPNWETETYQTREDDGTPIAARAVFAWANPIYWVIRAASDRPDISFDKIVTRTREVISPNSYYCVKFRMKKVAVFEPNHPSDDPFYKLKFSLEQGTPIAISVKTFAKYKFDADGNNVVDENGDKVVDKTWLSIAPTPENKYKINLQPSDYEFHGGHAICLCAYDDTKGAFRIKNSWGTNWGDRGYAWLSYDYVAQHAFMDDAFSIDIDRR